jgi:molecular chaperone DnaJ
MAKRDYYEILGVSKNSTQDDIKKAYRKLAMTHHPDKGGDPDLFKEIAEAYDVLSDNNKRHKYDLYGHEKPMGGGYDPMADFLRRSGMAGFGRQSRVNKGPDMQLVVKLTLEEIHTGVIKKYKYQRNDTCTTCSGKGGTNVKTCMTCNGNGMVVEVIKTQYGEIRNVQTCPTCNGDGQTYVDGCKDCSGSGVKIIDDTLELTIPAGVMDGMRMVLTGKGHASKNAVAGNLVVVIMELQHQDFIRVGDDLKIKVKLTYPQLILGDKVETPIIEGGKIKVNVPEFSKVGTTLRVPNKGLTKMDSTERGDLLFEIDLYIPKNITDEEKDLIIELKKVQDKLAIN